MAQMTQAQQKELQEKIKNMSSEELREFQKQNCIFCHIISGKVPSQKIYEDEKCIAILDIHPANPGHLLILPKEHYSVMPQMPEDILQHCFIVTKALSQAVLQALNIRGTNIVVANGPAAGQRANHFMIHLIPRREEDGVNLSIPENPITEEDITKIKTAFKPAVAKVFEKELEELGEKELEEESKVEEKKELVEEVEEIEEELGETPEEEKQEKKEQEKEETTKKEEKKEQNEKQEPEEPEQEEKQEEVDLDDIADLLSKK